jgi:hypothetical protein
MFLQKVSERTTALRKFDEPILKNEMEDVEEFLARLPRALTSEQLAAGSVEYDSMPKYVVFGREKRLKRHDPHNQVFIFFNDHALIEGVSIFFFRCNKKEVNRVIEEIHVRAPISVEMIVRVPRSEHWRIINPDISAMDH